MSGDDDATHVAVLGPPTAALVGEVANREIIMSFHPGHGRA
jgi:hypothetical protein